MFIIKRFNGISRTRLISISLRIFALQRQPVSAMERVFHFFFFCFVLLFCVCLCFTFSTSQILENETDRLALLSFKAHITSDPFNIMASWNDSNHFCEWKGITCSRKHQRVAVLNLSSQSLVGQISPHIGNLSFLKIINLNANSLSGGIPEEIGKLFRLEQLQAANNSLQGNIPFNISLCSNLLVLYLLNNHLVGELPMEVGSLHKINVFSARGNMLEGSIPPAFGNLTSLESLDLAINRLGGSIPSTLGQLKRLQFFNVGLNNLSGTFPSSLYNLSNLYLLGLASNHLTGSLPVDLSVMLPNIEYVAIGRNQFYGPLPVSLFNASKLQVIDIPENQFVGKVSLNVGYLRDLQNLNLRTNGFGSGRVGDLDFIIPLSNCSNLRYFSIAENHFGGTLPPSIANFSKQVHHLNFDANKISGNIPNVFENLHNLLFLSLSSNSFTGIIPKYLGNMPNMVLLNLDSNQLSGFVPSFSSNTSNLLSLGLSENFLQGSISPILEKRNLETLDIAFNNFSGSIPKEIGESLRLLELGLSNNKLNGSIPSEIGNLVHLFRLELFENELSGEIPKTLVDCSSLQYLYLDSNSLQGPLPSSLNFLKDLQEFNVSHNNLSGNIPKGLEKLPVLRSVDLSYNNFEGEVPMEGIFKNASAFLVAGNQNVCGGISKLDLPKCSIRQSRKKGSGLLLKVILGVLIPLIVVALLVVIYFRRKSQPNASLEEPLVDLWRISYNDLFKATSGFSTTNLIGTGRYGSVYKGVLLDGNLIAVKVLNLMEPGASKNFVAECETLRVARHRNLLRIHTVCSSVDFSGNDFKALVFQFMPNGNLDSWLHPNSIQQDVPRNLNLSQRLNIAIDVASGLDYLHNQGEIPIVHCDLKSSNVLLDDELTAHVADFGLAKFLNVPNTITTFNNTESSSNSIRGTIGYIPPEYGAGGKVSLQGDVYSYGILLLEMFTGKRPTDHIFKDGLNLHEFSRNMLTQQVMEIIDMRLLSESGDESPVSASQRKECFTLIVRIGVACSMDVMAERMSINNVLKELHSIKRRLF